MERKAANRVIICGAFNRERYRELINPSVVVKGAATPITQMRRTRLWQVRLAYAEQYRWSANRLVGREWSQVLVSAVCGKHYKHGVTAY